jgi:hypothetical protein
VGVAVPPDGFSPAALFREGDIFTVELTS